jgi:hypothetical protein
MPTTEKTPTTSWTIPKGILMYLSNTCVDGEVDKDVIRTPTGEHVFKSIIDMHFADKELVGCNGINGIALFRLNREDWHIAKYVVVAAKDVIRENVNIFVCGRRFLDED